MCDTVLLPAVFGLYSGHNCTATNLGVRTFTARLQDWKRKTVTVARPTLQRSCFWSVNSVVKSSKGISWWRRWLAEVQSEHQTKGEEDLSGSEHVMIDGARLVVDALGFTQRHNQKKKKRKTSGYNQRLQKNTSECTTRPTLKLCCWSGAVLHKGRFNVQDGHAIICNVASHQPVLWKVVRWLI